MLFRLMLLRFHTSSRLLSTPIIFSLFRTTSSLSSTTTQASPHSLSFSYGYGPSLEKGIIPSKTLHSLRTPFEGQSPGAPTLPQFDEQTPFDEHQFTRVFEVAALRVPSDRCYELESRLRGHLLNWPRIRNVARVPGDEIDEDTQELLKIKKGFDDENEVVDAVNRRIYGRAEGDGELVSGVMYRDKLAKEFNARGFVKFRNLAKISRPNKSKKKEKQAKNVNEYDGVGKGVGKRKSVVVEVVEDEENGGDDLRELLGVEFQGRKWRGSTRLLLLDERYASRNPGELPEAVKALMNEGAGETASIFELVRCKLTLFYDYWPLNEVLEALLPKGMIVPTAFETVGHIAHLNLRDEHLPYKKVIAKVVLDKNKPRIQTVVNKIEAISNDYRTMQLEVLSGNNSLVTTVIENGMRFQVDLATVYWNSRLATERQRLISCFTSDDVLCDVFAGVGPIAICAAKKVKRVYANDLNPYAVDYLGRNSVLNRLERKIQVFNMDGRRFIDTMFSSEKGHSITQVIMNLPNTAVEFLDAFRGIFRDRPKGKRFTLPMIHVYGFSKAEDPEFDLHERIRIELAESAVAVEMHRVRLVAPGKWMLCASFVLPEKVAFSKDYVSYK